MPCDPKAGRKENVMETGNADVGKMEAELRQWGARLDDLLATADRAGTARRIDYRERLDDAKQKYDAAEAKLAEPKAAGRGKWEVFRGGIESAWSELATAFTRLTN
jgi:multidrug resistance efflux pump